MRVRTLIFAILFGFAFTGYVQRQNLSIAAERMIAELGLTQIQVGWMFTAFLVTYSLFQVPGALVGQQWGARRTLTAIGLVTVIASLLTAAAPAIAAGGAVLATLLAARALMGVAQGALFPVESGTIRAWFPVGAWSSGMGVIVMGLWLGAAATSPLVAWLMQRYGWQAAIVITSAPALLLVLLWYLYARDRPEEHGAVTAAERAELAGNPPLHAHEPLTLRRILRVLGDTQILRITLSYFIHGFVFYLVAIWSFLYLVQERNLSVLESGWLAALPLLVASVAAGLGGRIADAFRAQFGDRVGMRIVPLTALPLVALFLFLTVSIDDPYWAVAALCLAFACSEVCQASFWGATMRLAPSDTMAATAVLNTGGNLGGVAGTPIVAALSAGYGWRVVFLTGAATSLAAALIWLSVDAGRESTKPSPGAPI